MGPPGIAGVNGASGGSGGSIPAAKTPATIAGLLYWFDASTLTSAFTSGTGNGLPLLASPDPYRAPASAFIAGAGNGAFIDTSTLNALAVLNFPGTAAGQYTLSPPQMIAPSQTIFVVFNLSSLTTQSNFIGGATNSVALGVLTSGKLQLQITNVIGIAQSIATLTTGTWHQVNTTYDTNNFSYRVDKVADISGASLHTASAPQSGLGWNGSSPVLNLNGKLAELIYYNKVLTTASILAVEAYLSAKWGV
jgi:hypothetical protein